MKIVKFFKSTTYKSDNKLMINDENMDATFDLYQEFPVWLIYKLLWYSWNFEIIILKVPSQVLLKRDLRLFKFSLNKEKRKENFKTQPFCDLYKTFRIVPL